MTTTILLAAVTAAWLATIGFLIVDRHPRRDVSPNTPPSPQATQRPYTLTSLPDPPLPVSPDYSIDDERSS